MNPLLGVLHLITLDFVFADYCEFGWCEDDKQYCCGKNKCCDKTLDLWFFWAGILIVIFVLAVLAICRKSTKNRIYKDYQPVNKETIIEEDIS